MRVVRNLLLILLAALLLPYLLTPLYRAGHPASTLMAWRWLTGAPVKRQWVDFSAISPFLPRSVVAAEDAKFCSHHGIDWGALREVLDDAEDGEVTRGGSTITQQVAKNLFLWPGRSVVRKALEFPLALWIDLVLPKQRILEIYLNIAEFGPSGQFGAETGSAYAFGRPASTLAPRESGLCWRRSCPIPGQAQRPQSGPRGAPSGRDLHGAGAGFGSAADAGTKITLFEPILAHFGGKLTLALRWPILYKRGLIGISARAKTLQPSGFGRCLTTTPLEDTDMAVPRRKTSPSRRGMRRSADALKKPTYAEDKDSGELRRPHHLDLKTGMYKGRQVLKAKKES